MNANSDPVGLNERLVRSILAPYAVDATEGPGSDYISVALILRAAAGTATPAHAQQILASPRGRDQLARHWDRRGGADLPVLARAAQDPFGPTMRLLEDVYLDAGSPAASETALRLRSIRRLPANDAALAALAQADPGDVVLLTVPIDSTAATSDRGVEVHIEPAEAPTASSVVVTAEGSWSGAYTVLISSGGAPGQESAHAAQLVGVGSGRCRASIPLADPAHQRQLRLLLVKPTEAGQLGGLDAASPGTVTALAPRLRIAAQRHYALAADTSERAEPQVFDDPEAGLRVIRTPLAGHKVHVAVQIATGFANDLDVVAVSTNAPPIEVLVLLQQEGDVLSGQVILEAEALHQEWSVSSPLPASVLPTGHSAAVSDSVRRATTSGRNGWRRIARALPQGHFLREAIAEGLR